MYAKHDDYNAIFDEPYFYRVSGFGIDEDEECAEVEE